MNTNNQDSDVLDTVDDGYNDQPPPTNAVVKVTADDFAVARVGAKPTSSIPQRKQTPYVGFRGPKVQGDRLATLMSAGIDVNNFYLFDGEVLKVKPFEFHLLQFREFFCRLDKQNRPIAARLSVGKEDFGAGYRQYTLALVAVYMPGPSGSGGTLVPAIMTLTSGLTKALQQPIEFIENQAADVKAWSARSKDHAISGQAKWPGGRFRVTAWGKTKPVHNKAKDEDYEMNEGCSKITPTDYVGVKLFETLMTDGFQDKVIPATQAWQWRCGKVEEVLV